MIIAKIMFTKNFVHVISLMSILGTIYSKYALKSVSLFKHFNDCHNQHVTVGIARTIGS